MTDVTPEVTIVEVGPRDGLQNEPKPIPAEMKIRLVDLLSAVGFPRIETASFVSPRWVPQMADGSQVMAGITRRPGTRYAALTPNMKGYEAAKAAGADEVAIFGAASETFSQKNINCSIAESMERFRPVAEAALADGIHVRGYISCAVVCPYEGPIAPMEVVRVTEMLLDLGCYEVSLGDTVGRGTPESVVPMLDAVLGIAPAEKLAGHYHDTNGRALDNVAVSLDKGLRVFDSSIGGLGGCPFAPGAKGNLDTGKLARDLKARGLDTGLDFEALAEAEAHVAELREFLE